MNVEGKQDMIDDALHRLTAEQRKTILSELSQDEIRDILDVLEYRVWILEELAEREAAKLGKDDS